MLLANVSKQALFRDGSTVGVAMWGALRQTTLLFRSSEISFALKPNSASTSSVCSPNAGRRAVIFARRGRLARCRGGLPHFNAAMLRQVVNPAEVYEA